MKRRFNNNGNDKHSTMSVILVNSNHLDWIRRNPSLFVNNLVSKLEGGETDPWPGYARWNGDGVPGTQVVACEVPADFSPVVVAGRNNQGNSVLGFIPDKKFDNVLQIIKLIAHDHGYDLHKIGQAEDGEPLASVPTGPHGPAVLKKKQRRGNKNGRK